MILGQITSQRSRWLKVQPMQRRFVDGHVPFVYSSCIPSFWMISRAIDPLGIKERATLLVLKKEEHLNAAGHSTIPFTFGITGTPIRSVPWSLISARYYDHLFVERNLDLDDSLVKEYFPVSVVVPAILNIYQDLLGDQFVEFTGDARDESGTSVIALMSLAFLVWLTEILHRGATVFGLGKETQRMNRDCYLDLFPRGMTSLPSIACDHAHVATL